MSALEEWNAVRDEAWDLAPRLARKMDAAITELTNENAKLFCDRILLRETTFELGAENKRAWGERDHYLTKLQDRNTQIQAMVNADTVLQEVF